MILHLPVKLKTLLINLVELILKCVKKIGLTVFDTFDVKTTSMNLLKFKKFVILNSTVPTGRTKNIVQLQHILIAHQEILFQLIEEKLTTMSSTVTTGQMSVKSIRLVL